MEPNWFQPIDSLVKEIKGTVEWLEGKFPLIFFIALIIAVIFTNPLG